ncbi:hypothetical protein N9N67_01125 [Bacteriovoracaceae bacterium]|nr:hypothetical protein [Bacteriovoracaceae bacterium]
MLRTNFSLKLVTLLTTATLTAQLSAIEVPVKSEAIIWAAPDALQASFSPVVNCVDGKSKAESTWNSQYETIKSTTLNTIPGAEIKSTVKFNSQNRYVILTNYVRPSRGNQRIDKVYVTDRCGKNGKSKFKITDFIGSDGKISQTKLDQYKVWNSVGNVTIKTTPDNNTKLEDTLSSLSKLKFPVRPGFRAADLNIYSAGGGRQMTQTSLSAEKQSQVIAEGKAKSDQLAQELFRALESAGFEQKSASRIQISHRVQKNSVGRGTSPQFVYNQETKEIEKQEISLILTVETPYDKTNSDKVARVDVPVRAELAFTPDYFEQQIRANGNCYTSKEEAVKARKDIRDAIIPTLAKYQDKTQVRGIDRQSPRDISDEGIQIRVTKDSNGNLWTDSPCVTNGSVWAPVVDSSVRFWSFNTVLTIKDKTSGIVTASIKEIKSAYSAINDQQVSIKINKIDPSPKFLVSKTKGKNRSTVLSTITPEQVKNTVCEALNDDENAGKSAKVVACRISDQNITSNPRPKRTFGDEESAPGPTSSRSRTMGNRVNTAAFEGLIPTTVETTLLVNVEWTGPELKN